MKDNNGKEKNTIKHSKIHVEEKGTFRLGDDIINNFYAESEYTENSKLPVNKIKQQISQASHILSDYQNTFEGVANSHIERIETNKLLEWINAPLPPKNTPIAILAGNAGTGKSVILKDLWHKLNATNIITLGLKADGYYVNNINDLEVAIGLEDSIEKMFYTLSKKHERVVLIIDQIDALSLSLSTNQSYLKTYKLLIRKLQSISNIRIVISVRTFDLEYDSELKYLGGNSKIRPLKITVNKLTEAQVNTVLKSLDPNLSGLSPKLLDLLSIPLHLNVFTKIYQMNSLFKNIKTLQDLYSQLWKQKIINIPENSGVDKSKCLDLLYKITSGIKITVLANQYEDEFSDEIKYLRSIEILRQKDGRLQFFHQTFFDFVFTKRFVEEGKPILKYLKESNQALEVRAKLKMIINYLREVEEEKYLDIIQELLFNSSIRFHLKSLVINLIGFQDVPTQNEIDFVQKYLLTNNKHRYYFLEAAWGNGWLETLINTKEIDSLLDIERNWKDKIVDLPIAGNVFKKAIKNYKTPNERLEYSKNLWFRLLVRKIPQQRHLILSYLDTCPDFTEKPDSILRILYSLKTWDNPMAKKLFETYSSEKRNYYDLHILEEAAIFDIDWSIAQYKPYIDNLIDTISNPRTDINFSHDEIRFMKTIFKINKETGFTFYFNILKKLIDRTKGALENDKSVLYNDFAFWFYSVIKTYSDNDYKAIFSSLKKNIEKLSKEEAITAKQFIENNIDSNSITILKLVTLCLSANSKYFINEIFYFLDAYSKKGGFNGDGNLPFHVRNLLKCSYSFFSKEQKTKLNKILLSIKSDYEQFSYTDEKGKKRVGKAYGRLMYSYLNAIPSEERKQFSEINRQHQSLKLKFGKIENEREPNSVRISGVSAPLPSIAYEKMSFKQWQKSFLKYGDEHKRDVFTNQGSKLEHGRAFEETVKYNPKKYYPLVKKLVDNKAVANDYIIHGLRGLVESNFRNTDALIKLFEEVISIDFNREFTMYLVWMTSQFIRKKKISDKIIQFLIKQALTHPDPSPDDDQSDNGMDYLMKGGNSVRGAAANRLTQLLFCKSQKDKIFTALFSIADDKSLAVRVSLISELRTMKFLDEDQTFDLFLKLTSLSDEEDLFKLSFILVQSFGLKRFPDLIPFFKKVMKMKDENILRDSARLLSYAWLDGVELAKPLLEELLTKSEIAQTVLPEVVSKSLYDKNGKLNERSIQLFERNLYSKNQNIQESYANAFYNFRVQDFPNIFPVLKKYVKSTIGKRHFHSYYEYLEQCSSEYPIECLKLMALIKNYKISTNQHLHFYKGEPIKVILGVYKNLDGSNKHDKRHIEVALKLYDIFLQTDSLRSEAEKALRESEI